MKRTEIISELCKRYKINAAEASKTLSVVLDNKKYRTKAELHKELDELERPSAETMEPISYKRRQL